MGWFGFFSTLCSGGVVAADTMKNAYYEGENRERARQEGKVTYSDGRGNDYLVSTGEKVLVRNGKVYSLKHSGVVLYDLAKENYAAINSKTIEEARLKGKKCARIYLPCESSASGYNNFLVEISTRRRYEVYPIVYLNKGIHNWDFAYYKCYLTNDGKRVGDSIKIDKQEFEALGGSTYGMTPLQYEEYERKERDKQLNKIMRRL